MNELLQKLLESQVLSEETKKEFEDAFKKHLTEAVDAAKSQATADVRAELTEQFVKERDALVEAVDLKVGEFLEQELSELKSDIESFRDLEAEYAEKIVEAKSAMTSELKSDLGELVDKLDTFLEMRLTAELEELREDVAQVRKVEFGRRVFEAFAQEYMANYADEESAEASLQEAQAKIEDLEQKLADSNAKKSEVERKVKIEEVLSPLAGRQRDVMEMILKNVETNKLEEAYKTFIGRVVRESTETNKKSEKEGKVLAEGSEKVAKKTDKKEQLKEAVKDAVVANGDTDVVVEEAKMSEEQKSQLDVIRRLAGLNG